MGVITACAKLELKYMVHKEMAKVQLEGSKYV